MSDGSPDINSVRILGTSDTKLPAGLPSNGLMSSERKRRSHQKSRKGCATCKKRKVKCSEEKPVCTQCHKLGLECNYEQRNGVRTSTPLPTLEISLMYYWTVLTGPGLLSALDSSIWVTHVPQLAFQNQYLLREIFSLTAAQLQQQDAIELQARLNVPIEQYIEDQRSNAFSEFRRVLDEGITTTNAEAMVATAILLAIQGFSVESLGIMRMFGGIKFVADELYKVLPNSIFNNLIQPTQDIPALPETFVLAPLASGALHQPIAHLAYIYSFGPGQITQELIFSWPALLTPDFLDLLDTDPHVQLVAYWYYHKLTTLRDQIWWVGESPAKECLSIIESLAPDYKHLLPNSTNQTVSYT